jgi:eukaryotic-like serine/threonine-protein kinase
MLPDLTGQQIDQYRLLRYLGSGGSGVVYLGEHIANRSQVALKILSQPLDTNSIAEFLTEAQAVLLAHPHIVQMKKFGVYQQYPFFVMPYLAHGNLRQIFPKGKRFAWNAIQPYIMQIADALQYIHVEGIVHRDIKPENMLLADPNTVLLSDFGIALVSYTINLKIQNIHGTLHYMAPEQLAGKAVRASDQYALGAVIYECLTGQPPFVGNLESVFYQHAHSSVRPPMSIEPAISPEINDLVLKMLAKNPGERFVDMNEFVLAVDHISFASSRTIAVQKRITSFAGHTYAVQTLAWSPDGKYIASAGDDKVVHVWDAITGQIVCSYYGHAKGLWSLSWSPDSRSLLSGGSDEVVQIWEAMRGRLLMSHSEHEGTIRAVAWSPSGLQVASAGDDQVVHVWDVSSSRVVYSYEEHTEAIYCLAWSPDGIYLASGDNNATIRIWNATTGEYVRVYRKHAERVTSLSWSPDGRYIASASEDQTIHVWEVQSGKVLQVCTEHRDTVSAVAWSPDGRCLVSGSWDQTVRLWEWNGERGMRCLRVYDEHEQWVNTVGWSPDGSYVASGGWDKVAYVRAAKMVE